MTSPKLCLLAIRYSFARPVVDTAELHNVRVAQTHQLVRGLLAAVSAAAVYENQLILVRQFRDILSTDGLVGDVDCIRDVLVGKLLRSADIQDNVIAF